MASPLDAETGRFDDDGYLVLRGVSPKECIQPLRDAFQVGELASGKGSVPRGAIGRHPRLDLDPAVQLLCRLPIPLAAIRRILRRSFSWRRSKATNRRRKSCIATHPIPVAEN